jgi:hypothetical protein
VQFGVAVPGDGEGLVVIVAEDSDGKLVILPDENHQDEAAVYLSGDPEVAELVETATRAYGPSARAMPVSEFKKLARDSA